MILTAHQPVYLPWLGLFHKIALADMFISFNQVQYQPKDWNNRNRIKTQSKPIWLSVPVQKKGYLEKTISDIPINDTQAWARKHFNAIRLNYAKAKYFHLYIDFFEDIYQREWGSLVELNEAMLKGFLELLGVKTPVYSAADWSFQGAGSELVLDMCRQVGAKIYIFGEQGHDYADIGSFERANIDLHFQKYIHPEYPQLHGDFVSHLSIVDLLFNCGDSSFDVLMSGNITREDLLK